MTGSRRARQFFCKERPTCFHFLDTSLANFWWSSGVSVLLAERDRGQVKHRGFMADVTQPRPVQGFLNILWSKESIQCPQHVIKLLWNCSACPPVFYHQGSTVSLEQKCKSSEAKGTAPPWAGGHAHRSALQRHSSTTGKGTSAGVSLTA